jgi:hypothetical protein
MTFRDRAVRLPKCRKPILNGFVVVAVLICAIVFWALHKSELNLSAARDANPIQYRTEFGEVTGSVWEDISISCPAPKVYVPFNFERSNTFRMFQVYWLPENKRISLERWANRVWRLGANGSNIRFLFRKVASESIFTESIRQLVNYKPLYGLNGWSCSTIDKFSIKCPLLSCRDWIVEPIVFNLTESHESSLHGNQGIAVDLVGLSHDFPLPFGIDGVHNGGHHYDQREKSYEPFGNWYVQWSVPVLHGWLLFSLGCLCCFAGGLCIQFWAYFALYHGEWSSFLVRIILGILLIGASVGMIHKSLERVS